MSLLAELKRRNVIRMAGLYLVATAPDIDSDSQIAWDRSQPGFRNSAGFKAVLNKLGVPAYWRKHGYPPQCRAQGSTDFICDEIQP